MKFIVLAVIIGIASIFSYKVKKIKKLNKKINAKKSLATNTEKEEVQGVPSKEQPGVQLSPFINNGFNELGVSINNNFWKTSEINPRNFDKEINWNHRSKVYNEFKYKKEADKNPDKDKNVPGSYYIKQESANSWLSQTKNSQPPSKCAAGRNL